MSTSNGRIVRMDPDPFQVQPIPDLEQQVGDLTRALRGLVAAAGDTSPANREEALATARRVLARVAARQPGT